MNRPGSPGRFCSRFTLPALPGCANPRQCRYLTPPAQVFITRCVIISSGEEGQQAGMATGCQASYSHDMENDEAHSPEHQAPEIVASVLSAVSQRSWERVQALADPEIELGVSARAEVGGSPNEHVWRSVHVHGADQLHAYLGDLYAALPSLRLEARDGNHEGARAEVTTEFSGVNNGGVPFDAFAEMQFLVSDGRVVLITAEVVRVSFGSALLTDPDKDPRRYFEAFLGTDQIGEPGSD